MRLCGQSRDRSSLPAAPPAPSAPFRFPLLTSMKSLILFLFASIIARADDASLQFKRIDLYDGRTLNDVTIKTYDPSSDRVLVVADGMASMIPLKVFPVPLDKQISSTAPRSGSSTATVTLKVPPPGTANAQFPVSPPNPDRTAIDAAENVREEAELRQHAQIARTRADRYFHYEYHVGSNAVRIRSLDLDMRVPEQVSGWTGRYRTIGKAYIEYFDSAGWSYGRANAPFEVVTEQKPNGQILAVDFSIKLSDIDR